MIRIDVGGQWTGHAIDLFQIGYVNYIDYYSFGITVFGFWLDIDFKGRER